MGSDKVESADLARARDIITIALRPLAFDSFQSWRREVVGATKTLLGAERGGFFLEQGSRSRWLADDPRPHLVDRGDDGSSADSEKTVRAWPVVVSLTPGDVRADPDRVVEGLGLSWVRVTIPRARERCRLVLHQASRNAPGFAEREQALLELLGPAIRLGMEQARGVSAPQGWVNSPTSLPALLEAGARRGLTPRQAEVAVLMGLRHSHKEIARRLGISPNTARRHEERVLRALGVGRRTEVMEALRGDPETEEGLG